MFISLIIVISIACIIIYLARTSHKDRPALFWPFVNSYAKSDKSTGQQSYDAVFTGSSVMKFWTTLEEDFNSFKVINRAIPGTKINEIGFYIDRLVNRYKPKQVYIYAGSNDIQGVRPRTADDVLSGFKEIVRRIHEDSEETAIFYISIIVSPAKSRIRNRSEIERANAIIQEYCESHEYLHFIDLTDNFLGPSREPEYKLFVSDGIHLTPEAYTIWKGEIGKYLEDLKSNI